MIIQSLFKDSALEKFSKNAKDITYLDWMQLDLLHRAVSINCKDYPGPYPEKAVIEMAKRKHLYVYLQTDARFPLKAPLETALGGPAYVESGLFTKYGHYVGKNSYYFAKTYRLYICFSNFRSRASPKARILSCRDEYRTIKSRFC